MLRGEIWTAVWPADPSKKERPVLVVSNNLRNQNSILLDVIVAKITSAERADGSKKLVNSAEDVVITLKRPSIIKCGALFSVEKPTLQRKLTQLSSAQIKDVETKLRTVLGLN